MKRQTKFQQIDILFPSSHHTLNMLPHYLWEFKCSNIVKLPNKIKTRIIFVKKMKVSFIRLNGYCYYHTVAQIVQRLLEHMREDTHATRQLHCQIQ